MGFLSVRKKKIAEEYRKNEEKSKYSSDPDEIVRLEHSKSRMFGRQKELSLITGYIKTISRATSPAATKKGLKELSSELGKIRKRNEKKMTDGDKKFNRYRKGSTKQAQDLYPAYPEYEYRDNADGTRSRRRTN